MIDNPRRRELTHLGLRLDDAAPNVIALVSLSGGSSSAMGLVLIVKRGLQNVDAIVELRTRCCRGLEILSSAEGAVSESVSPRTGSKRRLTRLCEVAASSI